MSTMTKVKTTGGLMTYTCSRKLKRLFCIILISLAGVLGIYPGLVHAHAEYERSDPPANAVIPVPPAEVNVWFSQELFRREGQNTLEVFGPDGTQVDQGDALIDDDDRTHMIVSLQKDLPAGTYTVRWRTLSADDGDSDSGEFTFTVDPEAAQVTPLPSPTAGAEPPPETPTPSPVPTLTPPPSPTPTPQAGVRLPCLSGVVLSVLALSVVAPRRRKQGTV
jgi:methionine-rich copper-binding protein CopC